MTVAEIPQSPVEKGGARFINFKIVDGLFEGTLDDGRVVEVESIHYRGDLGEIHITYLQGGKAYLAVRQSGKTPTKQRTY
jgi:hypothetical protein